MDGVRVDLAEDWVDAVTPKICLCVQAAQAAQADSEHPQDQAVFAVTLEVDPVDPVMAVFTGTNISTVGQLAANDDLYPAVRPPSTV